MLIVRFLNKFNFRSLRSFAQMAYNIVERGTLYTEDYRIYFSKYFWIDFLPLIRCFGKK